jgi:hypothetical protein
MILPWDNRRANVDGQVNAGGQVIADGRVMGLRLV